MAKNFNWWAFLYCLTAGGGVTILRIGMVASFDIWSSDGRLLLSPSLYALLNGAHIALVVAICVGALYPRKQP